VAVSLLGSRLPQPQPRIDLNTWPPLVAIYLIADVAASAAGGCLRLLKRGWSVNAARKTAMLVFALAVVPSSSLACGEPLGPTLLVALAAAAHQGWSANISRLRPTRFRATRCTSSGSAGWRRRRGMGSQGDRVHPRQDSSYVRCS